ncbi:MAG: hypothetical protein ACTSRU_18985 [Candidatus Hodarchaeales archaeon]
MSRINGIALTSLFLVLASFTSFIVFQIFSMILFLQLIMIFLVAALGEHYVSGKGYYQYSQSNGIFIGRVPTWIPLMWVFVVQASFVVPYLLGIHIVLAVLISGVLCAAFDLIVVEPLLCRMKKLWSWAPVEEGYFDFIPEQLDRFTAPPGNYLAWLIFPILMNWSLLSARFILPVIQLALL